MPLINQYLRCVCSALRIERPKDTTNNYGGLHLHCTYNIVTDEGEKNLTPCSFVPRYDCDHNNSNLLARAFTSIRWLKRIALKLSIQ